MTIRPTLFAALLAACAGGGSDPASDAGIDDPDGAAAEPDAASPDSASPSPDAGGPDAGEPEPDAAPEPPPTCAWLPTPVAVIDAYPGEATGDTLAAPALLVPDGDDCATTDTYLPQPLSTGEQVVALTGLVPGDQYRVRLRADNRAAFYVITDCSGASPFPAGDCALLVDAQPGGGFFNDEFGEFTAQATTAWIVVDSSPSSASSGDFELIVVPEDRCVHPIQCTDPAHPTCVGDGIYECVAMTTCAGDDAAENDDGPSAATTITLQPGTPASVVRKLCETNSDWYAFPVADGDELYVHVDPYTMENTQMYGLDAAGHLRAIAGDFGFAGSALAIATGPLAAGTYYVTIGSGNGADDLATYRLTAALAECTTSFDCDDPARPVCSVDRVCRASYDECTGETVPDADDGPSAAQPLTPVLDGPAQTVAGQLCFSPWAQDGVSGFSSLEDDWFRIDIGASEKLSVTVDWSAPPGSLARVRPEILSSSGSPIAIGPSADPSVLVSSGLGAGTYYLRLRYSDGTSFTGVRAYTLAVERSTLP